jgi:hypothetical protein
MNMVHYEQSEWVSAQKPDLENGIMMGRLRRCSYCGSMHPEDVASAIREGARGALADYKYGWPHKAYFSGIPNPHSGMLESKSSHSNPPQSEIDRGLWVSIPNGFNPETGEPAFKWCSAGQPAADTLYAKFYTTHLQDASDADRATIEQHLNLKFTFNGSNVSWEPYPKE